MKKLVFILNIVLATLIVVGDICYIEFGGLWLKGLISFEFALMGALNLVFACLNKSYVKYAIFMLVGLTLSFVADIIINLEFMYGAIIFAVAHVFYVISYCYLAKFKWKDLIAVVCVAIPAVLIVTLTPILNFGDPIMKIVCVIYAIIISFMVGKSISVLIGKKSISNIILVVGSSLFLTSDIMLLFDVFANGHPIFILLCLATYYPAQILLSYTVFQNIHEQNK